MGWASRVKHLYLRFRFRDRAEAELDEEVRSYFGATIERRMAQGLTQEEARRAVRLDLGGLEQVKERVRAARTGVAVETALQDARYALRTLRKNPGFAAIAVLVLALGIGIATAIFSVVNAVLLRPLPYRDPARLVALSSAYRQGYVRRTVTSNEVEAWRRLSGSLESIGSLFFTAAPMIAGGQSMYVAAIGADQELLTTLGAAPALGRNFLNGGSSHKEPSLMISHRLWVEAFHSDPAAIGHALVLDGDRYTVIGVLPAAFQFPRSDASYFPEEPDVIFPMANVADMVGRDNSQLFAVARLKAGVSLAQAEAELKALAPRVVKEDGRSVRLSPLDAETTSAVRTPLLLLFGASMVLLTIACTNIMNLLFARASGRGREMAIREAAGATRLRLIHQMLTESACLTALGGVPGLTLAWGLAGLLVKISPAHLPVSGRVGIDATGFGFVLLVCAGSAVLAGLFPALHASLGRGNLLSGPGNRWFGARRLARVQQGLTVAQVALGFALLATAALLTRSLLRLSSVDPGFRTEGVVGFEVAIPGDRSIRERSRLIQHMLEETRSVPGVLSAGWITYLPPETRLGTFLPFSIVGAAVRSPQNLPVANLQVTSEDYFKTVGMALARGRDFTSADTAGATQVMIVNEEFARRYFGSADPVGQHIARSYDSGDAPREIIGIVRDTHDRGLGVAALPTVYVSCRQIALGFGWIAVRTDAPAGAIIAELRRRATRIDASVPVRDFTTIAERLRKSLAEPRFYALLAGACGSMAVLFVTLGLYGVVSYSVSRRTAEIGVRMALGAPSRGILRGVLWQGAWMAAVGIGIGLALSLAASRVVRSLLFQVKPHDPLTLGLSAGLVLAVTLAASYVPARRASRVDPMAALRHE